MAYTSPTTRSTGNSISAAQWNADMVDNVKWLAGDSGGKPSCRVHNSANTAVTTATNQALTFDSERFDNGGMHSTVSNTSRLTVPSGGGGKYIVGGAIEFAVSGTGQRYVAVYINGTPIAIDGNSVVSASLDVKLSVNTIYHANAGDYFELIAYQDSGGNLNVNALANRSPEFWAMWIAL